MPPPIVPAPKTAACAIGLRRVAAGRSGTFAASARRRRRGAAPSTGRPRQACAQFRRRRPSSNGRVKQLADGRKWPAHPGRASGGSSRSGLVKSLRIGTRRGSLLRRGRGLFAAAAFAITRWVKAIAAAVRSPFAISSMTPSSAALVPSGLPIRSALRDRRAAAIVVGFRRHPSKPSLTSGRPTRAVGVATRNGSERHQRPRARCHVRHAFRHHLDLRDDSPRLGGCGGLPTATSARQEGPPGAATTTPSTNASSRTLRNASANPPAPCANALTGGLPRRRTGRRSLRGGRFAAEIDAWS